MLLIQPVNAQEDSTVNYKGRQTFLKIATPTGYGLGLFLMNELWYKKSPRTSFHFFNDNNQWKQMDKVGHFYTSYEYGLAGVETLKWAGIESKKAIWYGSLSGMIFQTPIEILDGFAENFGASWGDIIGNAAGSGFVLSQYLLWDEMRILPKFTWHRTSYAKLRPNVLGNGLHEEWLKDYNGQTYWLVFKRKSFFGGDNKHVIPEWINFALGYGADNLVYGTPQENIDNGYGKHYRQYYLSIDIDMLHFKGKSKFLNTLLYVANQIKLPLPTLQFDKTGTRFYPFYF